MPRNYASVQTGIWQDPDWQRLSMPAQHVYLMLLSQPGISYCGVLPLTEKRWCSGTAGMTLDDLSEALDELENERFVLRDEDSEELLVRSFMKHNGVLKNPKLRSAMASQYEVIHSQRLRAHIYSQIPDDLRGGLAKPLVDCGTDPNAKNRDWGSDRNTTSFRPTNQEPTYLLTINQDEDEFSILAKRALENRPSHLDPIQSVEDWLAEARRRKLTKFEHSSKELRNEHADWNALQIADALEPPPTQEPIHPSKLKRPDCQRCGGRGVLDDSEPVIRCPDCVASVAS